MDEQQLEVELRFIKLTLSSLIKTVDALVAEQGLDVDVAATVRAHVLTICDGVRGRAIEAARDGDAVAATAAVDALIKTVNEYFDYAASPLFPPVELVGKG